MSFPFRPARCGVLAACLAAVVFSQAPPLQRVNAHILDDGGLHVVLVGTGSPLADPGRASACTAVVGGGEFVLVDIGPSSWRKVDLLGLPLDKLSAILLTHFHSDHIGDLGEATTMSWANGRKKTLDVYGPEGVASVVEGFAKAYALDVGYRNKHHGETNMPRETAGAVAHTITLPAPDGIATVFERNGFKVQAFAVKHDPVTPAYGYRIEYAGRAVVFSGDTAKSENLARYAGGADILIHEGLSKVLINQGAVALAATGQTRRAQMARDILSYHSSPVDAAETAEAAKVDMLVFSHIIPQLPNAAAEQVFLKGVSEAYHGKVVMGKDGMRFDLAPKK
jgi:ribonuclease Z